MNAVSGLCRHVRHRRRLRSQLCDRFDVDLRGGAQGLLILLVSNVLEAEVSETPESVRQVLGDLPASAVESVFP